jgi:hypothetical protein
MDKLELVQVDFREPGNASAQELSSFVAKPREVNVEPRHIAPFASIQRQKNAARQAAREAAEGAKLRALAG